MPDPIFPDPRPAATPAQQAAAELLATVDSELSRRASEHEDGWRAFWEPAGGITTQQIADAMSTDGGLWLQLSRANLEHIATYAGMVGRTLDDYLPTECQSSLHPVTVNPDGSLKIETGAVSDGDTIG
jgi:hypothetical protein